VFEALEAKGEVGATLVAAEGVDFVDDDAAKGVEHVAGARAGEEQIERLGGGDEDMRRVLEHLGAGGRGGVAGADGNAQGGQGVALLAGGGADAVEWDAQVALDVVVEGFERREVKEANA
jgi:hypothetical protein